MSKKKYARRKTKIIGTAERPRLVVYRSLKFIYGQIVNDHENKTLLGVSNKTKDIQDELKKAKSKLEASKIIGEYLAKKAREKDIKQIVFDRNGYKYHGRVKALADAAREGGLEF